MRKGAIMPEPVNIGNRKQVFIDERFISSSEQVSIVMNPPTKLGPVILPEKMWESMCLDFCVSTAQDEGIYKMWYLCRSLANDDKFFLCYAISHDGIHWEKPNLGLFELAGHKDNNIVIPNTVGLNEVSVFIDPNGPQDERYKAVACMHFPNPEGGVFVHTSADGLHWNISDRRVLPFLPDTTNQVMWDRRLGKYVAHIRVWDPERKVGRIEMDNVLEPWPYTPLESPNYRWGSEKPPTITTEVETAFGYDENDPPSTDHYNSAAVEYPWADDAYFMFPSIYYHFPSPPVAKFENDGVVDIQMAVSRDGVKYHRITHQPYLGRGAKDEVDANSMYMCVGMLRAGNDILQYYTGYKETHGELAVYRSGAICAARQRLDGFTSADFAYGGGELTTQKLIFNGKRLVLNVDTLGLGYLKVSLLDESGCELAEFSQDKCDAIRGDSVEYAVTWEGKSDLSSLVGKAVQVRLTGYAAKLFAFQFID